MTSIPRLIATLFLFQALSGLAHAQATDVDCDKCIDPGDIAPEAINTYKLRKNSVTTSKIRKGAVTKGKLSSGLADSIAAAGNPRVLDGLNNEIGQLISIGENRWSMEVITGKGYLLTLSPLDGGLSDGTVYFSNTTCGGTAYVDFGTFGGYVTNVFDDNGFASLYYVAKDSLPIENFAYQSLIFDDGGCIEQAGQAHVYPILPNDPGITGVSTDSYPLPIHIELP